MLITLACAATDISVQAATAEMNEIVLRNCMSISFCVDRWEVCEPCGAFRIDGFSVFAARSNRPPTKGGCCLRGEVRRSGIVFLTRITGCRAAALLSCPARTFHRRRKREHRFGYRIDRCPL